MKIWIRNQKLLLQLRRTKSFAEKRKKDLQIVEKQQKAQSNLIAKSADQTASLKKFFHTEFELAEARRTSDDNRVNELLDQQNVQAADIARHLNTDGSKTRAKGKRKQTNQPTATGNGKKPAVQVQGKKGSVKVHVTGLGGGQKSKGGHSAKQKTKPKPKPKQKASGGKPKKKTHQGAKHGQNRG